MGSAHNPAGQLQQQLGSDVHVLHLPQVGSTNTRLKELVAAGQVTGPTVLVTDHQTAGRGTRSRGWLSAPPEESARGSRARDLALTYACPLPGDIDTRLSLAVGALLADAIERCTTVPVSVKWPNDLLAGDPLRKVGGILLESTHGWLLAGVGINVNSNPSEFPSDLTPQLTTLSAERARALDVALLQLAIVRALSRLPELDIVHWLARFRALDRTAGTRYLMHVGGRQALVTAVAVADSGELLLRDEQGGEHSVAAFTELERL